MISLVFLWNNRNKLNEPSHSRPRTILMMYCRQMLVYDPNQRITATAALLHPYVTNGEIRPPPVPPSQVDFNGAGVGGLGSMYDRMPPVSMLSVRLYLDCCYCTLTVCCSCIPLCLPCVYMCVYICAYVYSCVCMCKCVLYVCVCVSVYCMCVRFGGDRVTLSLY